jgi:hypothetical protein
MVVELRDVVGFRGEKLVELRLTDYSQFEQPLFRPGFPNTLFYALPRSSEPGADTNANTVSVPVTPVDEASKMELRHFLTHIQADAPEVLH